MIPWLVVVFACGTIEHPSIVHPPAATGPAEAQVDPVVAAMRAQPIDYTRHARCRMACRKIDEAEVSDILLRDGVLDPSRTRTDGECPSHALEGRTKDDQTVRIVYAACPSETRVITVIDLDTDWPCGDC